MKRRCPAALILVSCPLLCLLSSCGVGKVATKSVVLTGKAVGVAAKTTGKVALKTGKVAGSGIRYATGRRVVPLEREGNSFYVNTRLNRRYKARLVLDTGASAVQISSRLARRMGIDPSKGRRVQCTLADGSVTSARSIVLKEVRAGKARAKKVRAIVLENDGVGHGDGLLGMTFLDNFVVKLDTDQNLMVLRAKD